ncbi:MAG: efflux RND transporter permease subunit [Gammaproteobacteria bacterium]|nr:efflux RND transporter permease subunit [Gammaproteobacteria bacterium]
MRGSSWFIDRPVATTLLMLALMLGGLLAFKLLPLASLPQVEYPTIQVQTLYPGANADLIANIVTSPLERQLGQMPGLEQMDSMSDYGIVTISLRFSFAISLETAQQQVQAAISATSLPADAITTYNKVNPADLPIMTLAVSSDSFPLTTLHDMVDNRVLPKLSQVRGVGLVSIIGGRKPAVRVTVDVSRLAVHGLSLNDVRNKIIQNHLTRPKGVFDGPWKSTGIDANDQLLSEDEFAQIILSAKDERLLRLQDVAHIQKEAENTSLVAWANHQEAILISIMRQPNSNVIETVEHIQSLLPQLRDTLPYSVDIRSLNERTKTIREAISSVQKELLTAILLVVLAMFIFLRKLSTTLIPSVTVPLSLVGTFVLMYWAGFSINNLTLMAMTIATGFVVDDAIVMIENITRHQEAGRSVKEAAMKGAREITFTIISLTISLLAVFIPVLFLGGLVGRLFHEFALTLSYAILISAVISLSLTPMMCAYMLSSTQRTTVLESPHFWHTLVSRYEKSLSIVLSFPKTVFGIFLLSIVATGILFWKLPKGLFPLQNTGVIQVFTHFPGSSSFANAKQQQVKINEMLLQVPHTTSLASSLGVDRQGGSTQIGRILMTVEDNAHTTWQQTIQRYRSVLAEVPGVDSFVLPARDLTLETRSITASPFILRLMGNDIQAIEKVAQALWLPLGLRPELNQVHIDYQPTGLVAQITIDREATARYKVKVSDIDEVLYNAMGQRSVASIYAPSNQYSVILSAKPENFTTPDQLKNLYVNNAGGSLVPLASMIDIKEINRSNVVQRRDQYPAITLSFNLSPGYSLNQGVELIQDEIANLRVQGNWPLGVDYQFEGEAAEFVTTHTQTIWLLVAAVVVMYLVLGILYESYIHPLTILSTLPSASLGGLIALFMTHTQLDLLSVIALILLIGIVKKNGIMIVDFALQAQRDEGLSPKQAVIQACCIRLRPILMTTFCALFAAIPLAWGGSAGSELRQPIGVTLIGGLILSQILTLYSTPVIYLILSKYSKI